MVGGIEFENLKATELTLGLPWVVDEPKKPVKSHKRALDESEPKVIGWPPVRSFRKNNTVHTKKNSEVEPNNMLVKVSKDGAPYLRKIDINMYQGYKELTKALEIMFLCFSSDESSLHNSIAYEDKDGDLMLVGDVPWDMFISSCKRLRIMK